MTGQTEAMADLEAELQLIREGVAACWIERDAVSVSGPAAVAFLQGQCSQDVAALPIGGSAWSWVLQPQGKVEALCRVTRVAEDRMILDTDGGWGESLVARLNRFKLRTKADIVALPWRCLALRGPGVDGITFPAEAAEAAEPAAALPAAPADTPAPAAGEAVRVDASWPGFPGIDLLGADPSAPCGVAVVSAAAFELARISAGVPRMGHELTEKTIPAETGLVARTVSFSKGCYTGQELVARIDSRGGNVARHLWSVELDDVAPVGASVTLGVKAVGTLTSVAERPRGGAIALAYLNREVTEPIPVGVTWDGGATGGRALAMTTQP